MGTQWKVAGTYFEACNCEAACPCVFTSPPTDGQCTVLPTWHIEQGDVGGDGMNVALASHAPGHMLQVSGKNSFHSPFEYQAA